MKKGVCFDFNGTLYLDHDINHMAWKQIIEEIAGNKIDFEEYYVTGKQYMNYQIVTQVYQLINEPVIEEKVQYYADKKEVIYRKLCTDLHRNKMINGAEDVLNYLKQHNIPVILCTSSIKSNVDFYYSNLNLERWFDPSQTVYDTGEYSGKVDMYLECARRLNVDIKDCVIFEDSPKSIKEAVETGCPNIVIQKRSDSPSYPSVKQVIEDYTKLDYSIFE